MLRIEPVRPADQPQALALLAGGAAAAGAAGLAGHFEAMLSGADAGRCKLWWARTLRGPRAAAMTVRNPGRVAMVYYGPAGSRRRETLAGLLRGISDAALAEGLAFVQAMVHPADEADLPALLEAGYRRLAQLVYLRRELHDVPAEPPATMTWEPFRRGQEDRLAGIIEQTYVGSRDCPGLRGLRRMEDVVASHKASGIFHPKSWWIPQYQGDPVGCVLVNKADEAGAGEVVYLGVRPGYRRRGFGRAMLRRALIDAADRGWYEMRLAVDGANTPAMRLYRQEAFREVDRREVYIKPSQTPGGGSD